LRAPVAGRVGVFAYKAGSIVRAIEATALATVNQIAPIYVTFAVPQRHLGDLRAATAAGERLRRLGAAAGRRPHGSTAARSPCWTICHRRDDGQPRRARGHSPMPTPALWPGQLCDARVTLRAERDVVSAPREAVQIGQRGNFVFIGREWRRRRLKDGEGGPRPGWPGRHSPKGFRRRRDAGRRRRQPADGRGQGSRCAAARPGKGAS
jgi:multidrug efflux system membrane fusion protein